MRVESVGPRAVCLADPDARAARERLLAAAHDLRRRVFVDEQSVPASLEWDGLDDDAEHFVAWDDAGVARGTARLRCVGERGRDGKAERVAVDAGARGTGLGRRLMEAIERRAVELGLECIRLNAQVAVLPFYEKLGYVAHGDVFEEAGIDHRAMTRGLPADVERP